MPRIRLLTDRRVGWLTRTVVFRLARRRYGEIPEPLRAVANHPGLMWAGGLHELAVERAARRLDPALRDIVVHRVATVVGCSWCVDFGTMLALRTGLSAQRHRELARYRESDQFSTAEKVALEYADAMTAQPMAVTDELLDRLRAHFDDAELVELTYLVALENMRARTNHALGLTAQGYTSGDACPLPVDEQIRRAGPNAGAGPTVRNAAAAVPAGEGPIRAAAAVPAGEGPRTVAVPVPADGGPFTAAVTAPDRAPAVRSASRG